MHLTFAIGPEFAEAFVTVPRVSIGDLCQRLSELGRSRFVDAVRPFIEAVPIAWFAHRGFRPTLRLFQRRFRYQRDPVYDGDLRLDVRTAIDRLPAVDASAPWPKHQPQWIDLAYEILTQRNREANLQMQIGCEFHYLDFPLLRGDEAQELFLNGWVAAFRFFGSLDIELCNTLA
jgi:hypothetical protein